MDRGDEGNRHIAGVITRYSCKEKALVFEYKGFTYRSKDQQRLLNLKSFQ